MPTTDQVSRLYDTPLFQLVQRASQVHAESFPRLEVQASSLLSIKTGGCPENCSYCPQSAHYKTGVEKTGLMARDEVAAAARSAKANGASRFCMGAAWREVRDGKDFDSVLDMVSEVAGLGLEVCCTLGMLNETQAKRLKEAGLDFYNHNLDTSREHYDKIIQTRTYSDRLNTIENVRRAGLSVCTGGILGLGETHADRVSFIRQLVSLDPIPESITINMLVPFDGTPLSEQEQVDPLDTVRVIAALRVLAPKSMIRLSAGRLSLSAEAQFLCFLAGANSIFLGEKLLTSPNPQACEDAKLMDKLGLKFQSPVAQDGYCS
jgi:biotin synthase